MTLLLLSLSLTGLLAACGDDGSPAAAGGQSDVTLRLGYFPNVTHAPAIIGVEEGIFEEALGDRATLETSTYNAGTEATEAIFAGAIDATFIGPNPAINAFAQDPDSIRIIGGSTSGGASLVVRDGIESIEDLKGTTLSTPSLGNTQDVALRAWLAEGGLSADDAGGGDVSIQPQDNGDTLAAFIDGSIDGAWVPEPWATRLVLEGEGNVLVDEAELWPDGQFVTTHLVVTTEFLDEHPDVVKALLEGLLDAIEVANTDDGAKEIVNGGIEAVTGESLAQETIDGAWEKLAFTPDPVASSLQASKDDAVAVELLDDVELGGIYALDLLNEVLAAAGEEEVAGL